MIKDQDLLSIQEARDAVMAASSAQKKFSSFSQEQVDRIIEESLRQPLSKQRIWPY